MDPRPEDRRLPLHPLEEGMQFNITMGFEDRPICVGVALECLKLSMQAWLAISPKNRNSSKAQLHMFSGLSFRYEEVNNTDLNPPK